MTSESSPVIAYSITALLAGTSAIVGTLGVTGWRRRAAVGAVATVMFATGWLGSAPQFEDALASTIEWPEVRFLSGARLRPQADGMRDLVRRVRQATSPEDTVLLLPGDPNTEAWFERRRPPLSSLILFSDQYWPTYAVADIHLIESAPPKAIVIGPRNVWRSYSARWGGGDALVIDALETRLLPAQYDRVCGCPIQFAGAPDVMDLYLRR